MTTGGIDFWKGGAGIYSGEGSTLRLVDSTISDNTVTGGAGGGIYSFFGTTTTIERSTISGNTVNDVGGGLRLLGNASITVSYTHLDVYKRQGPSSAMPSASACANILSCKAAPSAPTSAKPEVTTAP